MFDAEEDVTDVNIVQYEFSTSCALILPDFQEG